MLTGDFDKLDRLIARFEAAGRFRAGMAERTRPIVQEQVEQCFSSGTDPYGTAWAPLKDGSGRTPLAGLNSDFSYTASDAEGVGVHTGKEYAQYHLTGTLYMEARRFVPDGRGLPPKWRALMYAALSQYVREQLQGGA